MFRFCKILHKKHHVKQWMWGSDTYTILHRHKRFSGKYATRKIHSPCENTFGTRELGVFSIFSLVKILVTSLILCLKLKTYLDMWYETSSDLFWKSSGIASEILFRYTDNLQIFYQIYQIFFHGQWILHTWNKQRTPQRLFFQPQILHKGLK